MYGYREPCKRLGLVSGTNQIMSLHRASHLGVWQGKQSEPTG